MTSGLRDNASGKAPLLTAAGLKKQYRGSDAPALKGVDISVHPGEIYGLLGPNGAGKTTSISIMSGLLHPDAGQVLISGIDLLKSPLKARLRFGLCPQEIALYPNLTVSENLCFFGRLYGLSGASLKERVETCLTLVSLEKRPNQLIKTCSGGMQRRANLAASLIHSPDLIFLDEPTAGIDAQSRSLILDQLKKLSERGVSMIYTTHYMEEAEQLCNRVAIIDEGRILAEDAPDALIGRQTGCRSLGDLFLTLTGKQLRDD